MAPQVTMEQIYSEIKKIEIRIDKIPTRDEMESYIDTVEIMNNPTTMRSIRESDKDIKAKRTKKIESAQDLLKEL